MTAASATVCPKCGHVRGAADAAPAWQCPACGIAYSKQEASISRQPGMRVPERSAKQVDLRERAATVGERDTAGISAIRVYAALVLLGIGAAISTFHDFRLWVPAFLASGAFPLWLAAYRRKRVFEDVPTSTIAAAAQGYAEIKGWVEHAPGDPLAGRLTNIPCVWYHYVMTEYPGSDDSWVETGTRGAPFVIRDATGECLVDPAGAEVICDRCQSWEGVNARYSEWSIRVGDPICAIGHFSTGGARVASQFNWRVWATLRSWQRDTRAFLARFDTNRDGTVTKEELAAAREAARREATRRYSLQGGVHALGAAPDGRPFVLVSANQERIARRYRHLAVVHLIVFFVSLGLLAFNLAWTSP